MNRRNFTRLKSMGVGSAPPLTSRRAGPGERLNIESALSLCRPHWLNPDLAAMWHDTQPSTFLSLWDWGCPMSWPNKVQRGRNGKPRRPYLEFDTFWLRPSSKDDAEDLLADANWLCVSCCCFCSFWFWCTWWRTWGSCAMALPWS